MTASSSTSSVLPNSGINVSGTGATRSVSFTPSAVGRSTVTFTVDDHDGHTSTVDVSYAASGTPASASGRYLYESSDLSSAVDVGDGHVLAASSEDNKIRLYAAGQSGRPVKTFDFEDSTTGIGATNADIESMARVGDVLYVLGSHGNNSDGDLKPSRRVLFTAMITGSGADTTLGFIGKDTGLWDDLRTWDQAHGNRLGFAAAQAEGVPANDPNGFNIEGFEFAPGSTDIGYLGFRAPLVDHDGKPSAVIVPVKNLSPLMTGTLEFDDPIYLDLGGRTIREIRKNSRRRVPDIRVQVRCRLAPVEAVRLGRQPGATSQSPSRICPTLTRPHRFVGVDRLGYRKPLPVGGKSVTLVTDSGDTTFYGDSNPASKKPRASRKSYVDEFTDRQHTPTTRTRRRTSRRPRARAASMSAGTPSPAPRRTS